MEEWWPQVKKHFSEDIYPELILHIRVPVDDGQVFALLFDASRSPYGVKIDPRECKAEVEYPWRDTTRIRSAKRSDLLRVLVPRLEAPILAPRSGEIERDSSTAPVDLRSGTRRIVDPSKHDWITDVEIYVTPRSSMTQYFPFHLANMGLKTPGHSVWITHLSFQFLHHEIIRGVGPRWKPIGSEAVRISSSELIVQGPGTFRIRARFPRDILIADDMPVSMHCTLVEASQEVEATVDCPLVLTRRSPAGFIDPSKGSVFDPPQ